MGWRFPFKACRASAGRLFHNKKAGSRLADLSPPGMISVDAR